MEVQFNERKWVAVNEYKVAYRQWGEVGKPIVLLHGIPMNSTLWHHTGLRLSALGYKVYAPEMLGLGYTVGPLNQDHSLLGQAKILNGFIHKMIVGDYILVGHDLGGGVAQILITDFSSPNSQCVLSNCVAFDSWPVAGVKHLIKLAQRADAASIFTPEFTLNFLKQGISGGLKDPSVITDELLLDIQQGLTGNKEHTGHFMEFLKAMNNKYTQSASNKLKNYRGAALVVWAQEDQYQPIRVGEQLRGSLANVDWMVIEGNHFHPLESTELVKAIVAWDNR